MVEEQSSIEFGAKDSDSSVSHISMTFVVLSDEREVVVETTERSLTGVLLVVVFFSRFALLNAALCPLADSTRALVGARVLIVPLSTED